MNKRFLNLLFFQANNFREFSFFYKQKWLKSDFKIDKINKTNKIDNRNSTNKLFGNKNKLKQQLVSAKLQQNNPINAQRQQIATQQTQSAIYIQRQQYINLNQYRQMVNQCKYLDEAINLFKKHSRSSKVSQSLKQNSENNNFDKYLPIMYSYLLRVFTRILRRQHKVQKYLINDVLGHNYDKLSKINLKELQFLNLFDYVAFFFQYELSRGVLDIISGQKIKVVNRFLEEMLLRMQKTQQKQEVNINNEYNTDQDQSRSRRYFSYLLTCCRCSQMINSKFYGEFLKLLYRQLEGFSLSVSGGIGSTKNNNTDLVITPHNVRSIIKFIFRMNNLTAVYLQIQVFNKLLNIILLSKDFNQNIQTEDIYDIIVNIISIKENFQYIFTDKEKQLIIKCLGMFENLIQKRLKEMNSEKVYNFIKYFKSKSQQNIKMFKSVYSHLINGISQTGEASINPIFIFKMISLLSSHESLMLDSISANWENKFMRMFQEYFLSQSSFENLDQLQLIFLQLLKKRLLRSQNIQKIIRYFYQNKSIIRYNKNLFIKELLHIKLIQLTDKQNQFNEFLNKQGYGEVVKELFQRLNMKIQLKIQDKEIKVFNNVNINKFTNNQLSDQLRHEQKTNNNKRFYKVLFSYLHLQDKEHQIVNVMEKILKNLFQTNQIPKLRSTLFTFISVQLTQGEQQRFIKIISENNELLNMYLNIVTIDQTSKTKIDSLKKFRKIFKIIKQKGTINQKINFIKNKHTLGLVLKSINMKQISDYFFQLYQKRNSKNRTNLNMDECEHILWRLMHETRKCYIDMNEMKEFVVRVQNYLNLAKSTPAFLNFLNQFKKQLNQLTTVPQTLQKLLKHSIQPSHKSTNNSINTHSKNFCRVLSILKLYLSTEQSSKNVQLVQSVIDYLYTNYFLNQFLPSYHFMELLSTLNTHKIVYQPLTECQQFIKVLLAHYEFMDIKNVVNQILKYPFKKDVIDDEVFLRAVQHCQILGDKQLLQKLYQSASFKNPQYQKRALRLIQSRR